MGEPTATVIPIRNSSSPMWKPHKRLVSQKSGRAPRRMESSRRREIIPQNLIECCLFRNPVCRQRIEMCEALAAGESSDVSNHFGGLPIVSTIDFNHFSIRADQRCDQRVYNLPTLGPVFQAKEFRNFANLLGRA